MSWFIICAPAQGFWHIWLPRIDFNLASFLSVSGIILGMGSANDRRRYSLTEPIYTQNDSCILNLKSIQEVFL